MRMTGITVRPLQDDLPFGARVAGLTWDNIRDDRVRAQINQVFEDKGMIVFEDVEPSAKMQVEISNIFGPLKDHPVKMVERLDNDSMPGVITIRNSPDAAICEIEGKQLATWQPWHFDHTYNNELNRAGVLRAEVIAPEGGMTAFADGIQIYADMDSALRAEAEGMELLYTLDMHYERQFFGLPETFREIKPKSDEILEYAKRFPRAIHPAVWTRETGEKVLHMCAYGCRGLVGDETPEGNARLAAVWAEAERVIKPYYHEWKPTDMLVWDNWRTLHQACGCDPKYDRVMHRTTIKGDYGFGRWETEPKVLETVDAMA
jgi:taurine dioxygenase